MNRRMQTLALVFLATACLSGGEADEPAGLEHAADATLDERERALESAAIERFFHDRHGAMTPSEVRAAADAVVRESRRTGLPESLILAVIHVESSANNFAVSRVGAMGLMQLRPETARAEARRLGIDWRGPLTLFDPATNIRLGVSYLDRLIDRFDDVSTALAAYNEGPTSVASRLRQGIGTPAGYSNRVLSAWNRGAGRRGDPI